MPHGRQRAPWGSIKGLLRRRWHSALVSRIICTVLLPEASAGLLRGLTITLISLIGFTRRWRDCRRRRGRRLAIRYGYRYETEVMVVTVVALIVLGSGSFGVLGDWLANIADKRDGR